MTFNTETIQNIEGKAYGVLGYPVEHSNSPVIHNYIFEHTDKNQNYIKIEIPPAELEKSVPFLKQKMKGFNVTVPHKKNIIPYLDEIDEKARWYGAVNTVLVKDSKLYGYNTDGYGFACTLKKYNIELKDKNVLILGAGGVASVIAHECVLCNGKVSLWARKAAQAQDMAQYVKGNLPDADLTCVTKIKPVYDVIINATPIGMWPKTNKSLLSREVVRNAGVILDTVYNPLCTRLMLSAKNEGVKAVNGLEMLISQGVMSQKIWGNNKIKDEHVEYLRTCLNELLPHNYPFNIILTGFMGSGKTTVGKLLAKSIKYEFIDLDQYIEKKTKMTINEIFEKYGEEAFRDIENTALKEILDNDRIVISLGGGTITDKACLNRLNKSRSFIIYLKATEETIVKRLGSGENRPLLFDKDICFTVKTMLDERRDVYQNASHYHANAENPANEVVREIMGALGI